MGEKSISQPRDATLDLAIKYRERLAGRALTPVAAKLYSQYARLREHQPGLSGWRKNEAAERLDEAMHLIEAALIERKTRKQDKEWRQALRRAGELLEWLSHPDISPAGVPTRLLAAAAYQLAGYPARSSALLIDDATKGPESDVVRHLLRADFPALVQAIMEFRAEMKDGGEERLPWDNPEDLPGAFQRWVAQETMSALGVLVAEMRWGDETRTATAVNKLSAIGRLLLHGEDLYSWFLAKLCAMVADVYTETSMRRHLERLESTMSQTGQELLERYLRQSYQLQRVLAWPSQIRGIERLASGESFALCAPTGSGKTVVAELGILQSLFPASESEELGSEPLEPAPLVAYLVPSRALAAEVEASLSRLVRRLAEPRVVVTGLYGGADWGPTDAWLTREDYIVLICTYEKAEALLRFLGPLFLNRVSLVVIDEAHRIQFDGNYAALRQAESRPLRLEVLCARLLAHTGQSRAIALSAVAAGMEQELGNWVAGQPDATPVRTDYRSTRQLIGTLECLPNRRFVIRYDLLDGAPLEFEEDGGAATPFIPDPLPPYPETSDWKKTGPETRLRPYLFWAAMHLAAGRDGRHQRAVMIYVTQHIGGYADDLLWLLESGWAEVQLPPLFRPPAEPERQELWNQCLESCKDYFGTDSREYRLLRRGVAIHHGGMPGRMARLLVEAIEQRIVNLVVATSTLMEGVNLPFETVLIPTLRRWSQDLGVREFGSLAGRAGRPGFSTEGRTLVLLPNPLPGDSSKDRQAIKRARTRYRDIIQALRARDREVSAQSPLAELLGLLRDQWTRLSGTEDNVEFLEWLERTAPATIVLGPEDESLAEAIESLDALDSILLAAIVELEELADEVLSAEQRESGLREIWRRSYAYYATTQEADLERIFLRRSIALVERIYPRSDERRRLYRTNLPPRLGAHLLDLYPELRSHVEIGTQYARWTSQERFAFIEAAVQILGSVRRFGLEQKAGRQTVEWRNVLHWWLAPSGAPARPSVKQISHWHNYVRRNFQYRFNWGLGNFIALAIDEAFGGELRAPTAEDWPATGLPWVVFWLKELIVWGTLEPVAAYLLARALATTRAEAETVARQYYAEHTSDDANELLNAWVIREWSKRFTVARKEPASRPPSQITVSLLRDFAETPSKGWRVLPVEVDERIRWVDPAGFSLAESRRPQQWRSHWLRDWDFYLDHVNRIVSASQYLP